MENLLNTIATNKEWIFSGIGVFFITIFIGAIGWFFKRGTRKGSTIRASVVGSYNTQDNHSTTIQGSNIVGGSQIVYNINPSPQPAVRPKNETGAALARKVHTLADTFFDLFRDITYPGLPVAELQNPKDSFLLEGFKRVAEVFKELYDAARELKPFFESTETAEAVEETLDTVSRLAQIYKSDIDAYLQEQSFAHEESRAGIWVSDARSRQIAVYAQKVFGDGRQKTIKAIEEQLNRLKAILAEYIRANTD